MNLDKVSFVVCEDFKLEKGQKFFAQADTRNGRHCVGFRQMGTDCLPIGHDFQCENIDSDYPGSRETFF